MLLYLDVITILLHLFWIYYVQFIPNNIVLFSFFILYVYKILFVFNILCSQLYAILFERYYYNQNRRNKKTLLHYNNNRTITNWLKRGWGTYIHKMEHLQKYQMNLKVIVIQFQFQFQSHHIHQKWNNAPVHHLMRSRMWLRIWSIIITS